MHTNIFDRQRTLQRYFSGVGPYVKLADIDDKSYESSLANIAHAYLQDKNPELLRHEIGFQLVEKSEDDNKAIGVFGFKIGKIIAYMPIFFVQGKIRGLDLLYVLNIDSFVPATPRFIDRLKKLQEHVLGSPTDLLETMRINRFPNLMQLKPSTMKWAMAQPNWLQPFTTVLIQSKSRPDSIRFPTMPIKELLEKSAAASRHLVNVLAAYPALIRDLYDAYGDQFGKILKTAGTIIRQYPEELRPGDPEFQPKTVPPADVERSMQSAAVEIYFFVDDLSQHKLTETEAKNLTLKGYFVRDRRPETSKVLELPEETASREWEATRAAIRPGVHNLYVNNDEDDNLTTIPCLVVPISGQFGMDETQISAPILTTEQHRADRRQARLYLVVPMEAGANRRRAKIDKGEILIDNEFVSAGPTKCLDEYLEEVEGRVTLRSVLSLPDGETSQSSPPPVYCIFTDEAATFPFVITKVSTDRHNRRHYVGRMVLCGITSLREARPAEDIEVHVIVDAGSKIRKSTEQIDGRARRITYYVPSTAWFVEVVDHHSNRGDRIPFLPSTGILPMISKTASVVLQLHKVASDTYAINRRPYNTRDTLRALILEHGLSEYDAVNLIKKAATKPIKVAIKYAQAPFPKAPVPPSVHSLLTSGNTGTLGNREVVTDNAGAVLVDVDANRDIPSFTDPLRPGGYVDQVLRAAIQTGQKEVLDTSVFSQLLEASDDRDIIEKYLPAAISGLDAIGRILFNFYMHYEVFVDRYGENELESLEQNLRNVFRMLGDIIIRLEQRPYIQDSYKQIIGLRGEK